MKVNDVIMRMPYGVLGIMGMRGSGKTYLAARIQFPTDVKYVYYIDVVGAFRRELPHLEYIEFDVRATKEAVYQVLDKAASMRIRELILDVSNLSREDLIDAVNIICAYLLEKERPCALVIDEAGDILEQERAFYATNLERAVRIGRNKGILFVVLITQRPQKINKHAFTLSDYYAIFKFVHNLDLEAVRGILGYSVEEFREIAHKLKSQGVGEYLLTNGLDVYCVGKEKGVIKDETFGGDNPDDSDRRRLEHTRSNGISEGIEQDGVTEKECRRGKSNSNTKKPYRYVLTPARAAALAKGRAVAIATVKRAAELRRAERERRKAR